MGGPRAALVILALVAPLAHSAAWKECDTSESLPEKVKRGKTIPARDLTIPTRATKAELDDLKSKGCTPGRAGESLGPGYGLQYRGCQNKAISGRDCQFWTEQIPHPHKWMDEEVSVIKGGLGDHNFCRNPAVAAGGAAMTSVWCYTLDPTKPFEECCPMACGNGKVEVLAGEECDDGNNKKGDGCDNKCKIEPSFQCFVEVGAEDGLSYCKRCRDGRVDAGEECDDGNEEQFDGCDPYCYVEEGWWCRQYDCSLNGLDYPCPATDMNRMSFCKPDVCGDGIVWRAEQCDDGNTVDFDGCSSDCKIEPGFTCESTSDDKYGRSRCFNCGNGIIDAAEDCDDANSADGDGCSALCFLESGAVYADADGNVPEGSKYICTKAPSTKTVVTLFVEDEVNTTTTTTTTAGDSAGDSSKISANASGADRMLAIEVFSTHCKKIVPFHEENQTSLILYAGVTITVLVLGVVLGLLVHKWHKNKLRLKQGEVLSIGKDGRVKKVNTLTAILVVQMQLKRQIKRRRELKAMEAAALEKQELLKKQAARLQEKKWRKAMQEGPDEEQPNPDANAMNNYVSDHV